MDAPGDIESANCSLSSRSEIEVWYAEAKTSLLSIAYAVAPPEVEPEDLLHDALLKLLRALQTKDIRRPAAYVCTTMVNAASNHRRRWSIRRDKSRLLLTELSVHDERPSDLELLKSLPPRERAVLYLAVVHGLDHASVGAMVGCSASASRKALSRARERLRSERVETDGR